MGHPPPCLHGPPSTPRLQLSCRLGLTLSPDQENEGQCSACPSAPRGGWGRGEQKEEALASDLPSFCGVHGPRKAPPRAKPLGCFPATPLCCRLLRDPRPAFSRAQGGQEDWDQPLGLVEAKRRVVITRKTTSVYPGPPLHRTQVTLCLPSLA